MAPNAGTSVHSQATSDNPPHFCSYAAYARKRCSVEFTATQSLYRHFDSVEGTNREERLLTCRSSAWFVRSRIDGHVRVASNHCRLRWCPLCSRSRQGFITAQVDSWFADSLAPKFLTLTMRHTNNLLSDQITQIYRSFRGFRRSTFIQHNCFGGVWFFQITYNPKTHQWHPHLHCLIDSKYLHYLRIRQLWHYHTGGSDILDIRAIYSVKEAAQYVARYSSRPHDLKSLPIDKALELMTALHGRRLCGSWGTAKTIKFSPYTSPRSDEWEPLGSWTVIHQLAATNPDARQILIAFHTNQPLDAGISFNEIDQFIEGACSFIEDEVALDPHPPPPTLF